jgi:membrane protein YqaA with SNARE-associated domain
MGLKLVAALWGFAEATLFFIVPDILMSAVGIKDLRRALVTSLWTLAGALLGGLLMYFWGAEDHATATAVIDRVPAISGAMLDDVRNSLSEQGLIAVLLGPLFGIPYKTFAINASTTGISLLSFMLISIPARLIRFVLIIVLVHYTARLLARHWAMSRVYAVFGAAWITFYVTYFTLYG